MLELFPLNSFQQIMLKWTALAPYNAGHVMEVPGSPQIDKWERIVLETIQEIKLGLPQINKNRVSFAPINQLKIKKINENLNAHIAKELNQPFAENDFPIRFFCLQESDHYYIGAIYDHWLSDSYSMRALFYRIYQRYHHNNKLPPLSYANVSFRELFKDYIGKPAWWYGMREFIRCLLHFQSAYRLKLKNTLDFQTGFNRYDVPQGLINRLNTYAKENKVSINDIFIAALAKTMDVYTRSARQQVKRKKFRFFARNRIAIGTIVDIRQPVAQELENTFGQYLSNYTLVLKNPETITFQDLVKSVNQQTSKIKKSFQTIKNFASWDISLFLWKFLKKAKTQAKFFTKHAPIAAGISNVNLTDSWVGKSELLDYLRISPTGLLIPLVFTVTTISNRVSLCVSYRTTAFAAEEVNSICKMFIKNLMNIKK